MILKAQNMFEPNVFKCVVKIDFTNFNSFFVFNHQYSNLHQFWKGMEHIWLGKKTFEKKKTIHPWILNVLSLLKHHQFHQILRIKTLQSMEPISKIKLTVQIIVPLLWFFKNTKLQFETMSAPLGGSYDYDCTPRLTLGHTMYNFLEKLALAYKHQYWKYLFKISNKVFQSSH
jgi:hypothetical protein